MHEAGIAQTILETVLQHAEKLAARPLLVNVSCGLFNAINEEALQFAFQAAATGTPAQGATVHVRQVPIQIRCNRCGHSGDFDVSKPACPACGSSDTQLAPDSPIMLDNIEFEDPS